MPRKQERIAQGIRNVLEQGDKYLPVGLCFIPFDDRDEPLRGTTFCRLCSAFLGRADTRVFCRQWVTSCAYQALRTGEPHFFRCWLGLNTVVFAVAPKGKLIGAVEVGGFFYEEDRDDGEAFVRRKISTLSVRLRGQPERLLGTVPSLPALEIRGLASFVEETLFSAGLNDVDRFRDANARHLQQRRIGELMQSRGNRVHPGDAVYDLLAEIGRAVGSGDRRRAMLLLDEFLSRVMLSTGLDAQKVRLHVQLLAAVLARETAMARGQTAEQMSACIASACRDLQQIREIEELCFFTAKLVERQLDSVAGDPTAAPTLSERVLTWIEDHFVEKVTIDRAAQALAVSTSTLAKTLRAETGMSFHRHLEDTRLREVRRLLAESQRPVADIATACGFYDSSHLNRAFRAATGVSPREYRKMA